MNIWELRSKFNYDSISAMVAYAESKSQDKESTEYKEALMEWVNVHLDDYRTNWEEQNGSLEGKICQTKNTKS